MHRTLPARPRPTLHTSDPPCIPQTLPAYPRLTFHAPDPPCMPQSHITCTRPIAHAPDPCLHHCHMHQTLPASTRPSLHTPDPDLMHQILPASTNPMSHGSDPHHMHQTVSAHPKPSLHAPNPHLMHQTLPSSTSPISARAASQSVSGTMGHCRSWGCSAIDILLFNGFMLHLQRDTGAPEQVDEPGALFSPPHKVSAVAVAQNPLLGACSAYKISVFPPSLSNRHVVL